MIDSSIRSYDVSGLLMQSAQGPMRALVLVILALILAGCGDGKVPAGTALQLEKNKIVARRFIQEFWDGGDLSIADELLAADYVDHSSNLQHAEAVENLKQLVAGFHSSFPESHFEIHSVIAEGEYVAIQFTATLKHDGAFMGIAATGKRAVITGIDIYRIVNGRIVEEWENHDELGFLVQIGAIPMPAETGTIDSGAIVHERGT